MRKLAHLKPLHDANHCVQLGDGEFVTFLISKGSDKNTALAEQCLSFARQLGRDWSHMRNCRRCGYFADDGGAARARSRSFAARTLELLQRARAKLPPVDALQHFFERSFFGARGASDTNRHSGCMLVNTVLEMAGVDDELAARASRNLGEVQHVFQACLQDAGASPARAEELAAMLMLVNEGIRVSSRRRVMGEVQQRAAENGQLKEIIFGRNEPALHHFHRNYREALNQPPLEPIK